MGFRSEASLCTWPAVDVAGWPAPRVPFPVSVPYRPRPDMVRLGSAGPGHPDTRVLDADRDWQEALRAKWLRLREVPGRCVALEPALAGDPQATARRVGAAIGAIVAAQAAVPDGPAGPSLLARVGDEWVAPAAGWAMPADPQRPFSLRALRPDAGPLLDWIAGRPAAERPLHALALALQEDVAWVEAEAPGAPVRAAMLHVCWPSGWAPAAKVGLDFAAIHRPVADGAMLRSAAAALSRAMVSGGPYLRHVWTLAATGARSRHPDDPPADAGPQGAVPALWFRCERQVSLPIADAPAATGDGRAAGGAALFLIRLHVSPLGQVLADPARRARLLAALASMSDATLDYKGLGAIRARLLAEEAGPAPGIGPISPGAASAGEAV
jgi:hypothetical protein